MRTLKGLAMAAVLATASFLAVPASAAPPTTRVQSVTWGAAPAMLAPRQDPVPDERAYAQREANARDLEDFEGGAIGLVAAILIVLLVLLLI